MKSKAGQWAGARTNIFSEGEGGSIPEFFYLSNNYGFFFVQFQLLKNWNCQKIGIIKILIITFIFRTFQNFQDSEYV